MVTELVSAAWRDRTPDAAVGVRMRNKMGSKIHVKTPITTPMPVILSKMTKLHSKINPALANAKPLKPKTLD